MKSEQDNLAETLRRIASGSRRSKIARFREIFDVVETAKAAGASNKTIVDGLAAHGLFFDVNGFKNARSRIIKERAMEELVKTASTHIDRRSSGSPNISQVDNETANHGSSTVKLKTKSPPKPADKLEQAEGIAAAVDLTKQTFANKQDTSKYNAD
jgi:hypothetical protein